MYGHRTGQLQVLPFTYLDAARFHPGYLSTFRISERREIPVRHVLLASRQPLERNQVREISAPDDRSVHITVPRAHLFAIGR